MKVLYFTRDYTTHDRRFLASLVQTEHQIYYLRLEQRGHSLEDRPMPDGVEIVPWAGGRQPFEVRDFPRLLVDLKRVLRVVKPDLIHAGPVQTSALLAAVSGFRPLVSMSWGSDLLVTASSDSWNRWATRYVMRHSASFIGDCDPVRQKAIEFGMPDERIVTFPWGIDLEHFSPAARNGDSPAGTERPFTLLSTRGWEPIYGVDVIARAFVQANQVLLSRPQLPPALRLVMLGNGSQAGLLRRIITEGGAAEQVFYPGQVSTTDLPRYYRSADLYVAASHSDGTSISLLEAMGCGRPVLVSDIPGNREWVQPGEQGWLFPDGDPAALAQGIVRAVDQRSDLLRMGAAARRTAEARANWEVNFQRLLDAYKIATADSR